MEILDYEPYPTCITTAVTRYVPIARPEVWEEEPYSARLRWHRAYIPRYYSTPLKYRIEMQENGDVAAAWKPVATDIKKPDVTVNELSPKKDYNFRIRAELENGDLSDPTPPMQYHRSKDSTDCTEKPRENVELNEVPMTREPFALAEYKPVEYDHVSLNRSYVDHLTKFIPPRLPIDKPGLIEIDLETVELSWRSASVPESIRNSSNLTYTIEVRNPPNFEWRQLISGIKVLNHTIPNLHSKIDYVFRIRAWNEYGCSEPSLPVSVYRPINYNDYDNVDDDEEFEREWELRFGQQDEEEVPIEQVPPKLPMDTPKINTQTDTSIWFTWLPARIPAYATQTPITYVVELKEVQHTGWRRDVTGLVETQYVREGLNPKRDYSIRVRAETEFGTSEPTLPIMIQRPRGSRPGSRLSSVERDLKDEVTVNTTFLDNLTSTGPPRMTSSRPQISDAHPTSLTLSWTPSRVPSYVKNLGVSYIIEKREPPGHIWCAVARDVPETSYEILGLNPEQDYMFRVRAKNEHGISDPTLPVSVYRERDDYVPNKIRSRSGSRDSIAGYLSLRSARRSSSIDYGSSSGGLKTPDEEFNDKIPRQPEYVDTSYDTQYGVEGKHGKVTLKVKGFPLPTVHWYFGEEKLHYGDQFNAFVTPTGVITLEIKNVTRDSVGEYKCYAENEHGASVKVVSFDLAEPPTVLDPLTDQDLLSYNNIKMQCKVDGYPNPSIKWMKDWKPLSESARVKILHTGAEDCSIEISKALISDSGVYACVVENAAGKVTTACRVTVEEESTPREVILKSTPIEESYTILEEVRRGEHGVTRRVIELATGNSYEAQFIYMRNRAQKNFFLSEFEVLRTVKQLDGVLKIHDAFQTERSLVFVTEPLPGTSLLEKIAVDGTWTETDVAMVIKSLLNTLKDFEDWRVLYLDMKPSNIRMCGTDGKEVKLVNFAMSRIQDLDEDVMHNYGTVGYASPEQITNDLLTGKSDTWGIGVLTYVLLTGNAPFRGDTDVEVLNKMAECEINFDDKDFGKLSKKAQDFLQKLLVKQQSLRMSVDECMRHPWIQSDGTEKINAEKLNKLDNAEKAEAAARQVQTTAMLQSLSKIRHGTAALYQPAIDTNTGEIIFPDNDEYGDYLDEDAWYEWQLQYCDDPDSQNFPLMDKNFTVRESKHTAEKKDADKDETEESDGDGSIYFRNKIQTAAFSIGDNVSFMCTVVSKNEKPIVTWYRDETLLSEREAYRTDQLFSEETGIAQLIIQNAKDYDGAVYKCVARNKEGRVSCEARMLLGEKPAKPGRPVVIQTSGSEAFVTWSTPVSDGNSYILGYRVDYRKQGTTTWSKGPYVTEEYGLVSGLSPQTSYVLRVSCHNKYGTSPFSVASIPTATLSNDAQAIAISGYLEPLLQFSSFTKQQLILPAESRRPSLSVQPDAKVQKGNAADFFNMGETVSKGKYGEYKLCTNKSNNKQCVAKIMPFTKETHVAIKREFEILKNLRQLHIITVIDAYIMKEFCYVIFEHLSGLNIIQYLCLQKSYKEDVVARVVKQILDALQYLQAFGIAHLNLQPSSIAMSTRRRPHIKLRDFTLARKLKDGKVDNMNPAGYPDYVAPEVIKGQTVAFPADLWSLGALTFTLLSGVSPFGGADLKETLSNILFDRYKGSDMYDNVSKESIKFINKLVRRLPRNRPTVIKCLNSRWLQLSDNMLNSRQTRAFPTERLRDFLSDYSSRRVDPAYMDISSVPLEDLPKPTPGPIVQPILSDKVTNRYEFKPKTTVRMEREENEKTEMTKPPVLKEPTKEQSPELIAEPEVVQQGEGSILNAARKELQDLDKKVKPAVAKKPLKQQLSKETPVEPEISKAENSSVDTAPDNKMEEPVSKNGKKEVNESKDPNPPKKESKMEEVVEDKCKDPVSKNEKKEVNESKNPNPPKKQSETEEIVEDKLERQDGKTDSESTIQEENNLKETSDNKEQVSKDEKKEEESKILNPPMKESETEEIVEDKLERPDVKSDSELTIQEQDTLKETSDSKADSNEKETEVTQKPEESEPKKVEVSEDKTVKAEIKQSDDKTDSKTVIDDLQNKTEDKQEEADMKPEQEEVTEKSMISQNIEQKSEKQEVATSEQELSIASENNDVKELQKESEVAAEVADKPAEIQEKNIEQTELSKENSQEVVESNLPADVSEPVPVVEECISPEVKSEEQAALPINDNKEAAKEVSKESIQELSDALNQLDKEVVVEKTESSKEKSPEPITEEEILSAQKDDVESKPPQITVENTEENQTDITTTKESKSDSETEPSTVSSEELKAESSENSELSEQNKGQVDQIELSVEKENQTSEIAAQKEDSTSDVTTEINKESTKEENRDSDDSEIHKLEQDAIPEKLEQVKEEAAEEKEVTQIESKEVSKEASKEEVKEVSDIEKEEPNEEDIADLCMAIDDALMFC